MPDEAEKMKEKFDQKPRQNMVYFAPGDPENPYNWSLVGLIDTLQIPGWRYANTVRNAKPLYRSLVLLILQIQHLPQPYLLAQ